MAVFDEGESERLAVLQLVDNLVRLRDCLAELLLGLDLRVDFDEALEATLPLRLFQRLVVPPTEALDKPLLAARENVAELVVQILTRS